MVESSKILTVSYGTFSCTLEGFDDAFDTMKAIAEYFRDLAADDRYFGAEPPTPDPEMLARIAERDVEKRVEARLEQGGYVLRPAALAGAATAGAAAPAASGTPDTDRVPAEDTAPATAPAPTPAPEPEAIADSSEGAGTGAGVDTASDAPRAEAPAPQPAPVEQPAPVQEAAPEEAEPETIAAPQPAAEAEETAGEEPPAGERPWSELTQEERRARREARREQRQALDTDYEDGDDGTVAAPAAAAPAASAAEPESVAAKLARIRAVVGRSDALEDTATEETGEADADTVETPAETVESVDEAPVAATADEDEGEDAHAEMTPGDDSAEDDPQDDSAGDEDAGEAAEAPAEPAAPSQVRARVVRMKRSEFEATMAAAETEAETAARTEDRTDLARLDGIDEYAGYAGAEDMGNGLSEDDEADLMEELADVERMGDEATDDVAEDEPEDEVTDTAPDAAATAEEEAEEDSPRTRRAALLSRSPEDDAAGMSRILSETDAQLQEPEGNRRREAIAHLKAAVAATEAARRLGEESGEDEDGENMFREDLDQVVRPRRTARPEHRSDRPRPAPLKLVASQRVDVTAAPDAGPAQPVRPRRVQAGAEAARAMPDQGSVEDFARFAADTGASGLADMLEAAAAHAAFVEGAEDVSRPQIMKKVAAVLSDDFSREDGLRAFGTLLRQDRIRKVRNGRFQVSPNSRFRPTRAASGG